MSRRNSSGTIAKILQDITWDAGLGLKSVFRGLHKQRKKSKTNRPQQYVRFVYKGKLFLSFYNRVTICICCAFFYVAIYLNFLL